MKWIFDDGGRAEAGYKGQTGDCAVRAIAIATGKPYQEVYEGLSEAMKSGRCRARGKTTPRNGTPMEAAKAYMQKLGWQWVPTMRIGSGCKVHLREDELPAGRLVVRVSKHFCAVVDGVIRDSFDASREGSRCVYGYWRELQS